MHATVRRYEGVDARPFPEDNVPLIGSAVCRKCDPSSARRGSDRAQGGGARGEAVRGPGS